MKQAKTLSKQELNRALAVASSGRNADRNRIVLLLSYYAGLRAMEIAGLCVSDVFADNGQVRKVIQLNAGKTKGSIGRPVFVNSKLARSLRKFWPAVSYAEPNSPLIKSQKKRAFSPNSMCQLMCRLYRTAGLDGATSHSGRRSFITNLANKGVSAHLLMHLAGHKNLATTQRYIDVNDELLFEAIELAT